IICSPMTSLKTSIKTITYLSDIGCLEIQGASLITFITDRDDPVISGMNDIRLKFRTAVRVTVPVTDGWPDAIACILSLHRLISPGR
ncbi:hypothetical protein ACP8XZ_22875, partial [Escherichia coli]